MPEARERLIVALDVATAAEARRIVQTIGGVVTTFKIGKQLFTAEGPKLVRELVSAGHKVFLDLKFHDIPNTVDGAVRSAATLGVSMLTVHACGGSRMLHAAVAAAGQNGPIVLAVTVLTSLSDADLRETGVAGRLADQVLRLADLAKRSGCGGVVASPQEVKMLRQMLGQGFAIVTPGVRPPGASAEDQARVATPAQAIRQGASHVVVGRPIIGAADPRQAAEAILQDIAGAI